MQSQLLIILFTLWSLPSGWHVYSFSDHALYLSLVEVEHKDFGNTASVKIKVFANDMEDAIMNASNKRIDFLNLSNCERGAPEVEAYFSRHFNYVIDGVLTTLVLTKCEPNGDAIWFHFTINCPDKWSQVDVKADFLMELFPTQSNVITIRHGEQKRFLRITHSNPQEIVKF
ncbi:MAG: hypothetical protein KF860_06870 [Cyclobacteriaceae bacterium]|nr:hypothetical protein [Cyclobacteriaceae bacterium]